MCLETTCRFGGDGHDFALGEHDTICDTKLDFREIKNADKISVQTASREGPNQTQDVSYLKAWIGIALALGS